MGEDKEVKVEKDKQDETRKCKWPLMSSPDVLVEPPRETKGNDGEEGE